MSPQLARIDLVAIGGSAGAVEALRALLEALPAGFRPSIVVVLHLRGDRPSLLADLFAARCALPVREAQDKDPIDPGTVYFAPPDYHLLFEDESSLALSADEPVAYSRPSIDVMFESAASVFGPRMLGIVLSGANSDGAEGLAAIRAAGGLAWVQDPATAAASPMPAAALQRAGADLVLALPDMAERLAHLRSGTVVAAQ